MNIFVPAPASDDPASSFISLIMGGFQTNETYYNNQFVGFYIYRMKQGDRAMGITPGAMSALTWSVSFPGAQSVADRALIVDGAGNSFTGTVSFAAPRALKCSAQAMVKVTAYLANVIDYANGQVNSGTLTMQSIGQTSQMMAGVLSKEAYVACYDILQSMAIVANQPTTITGSSGCQFQYGTLDWANDPCCNSGITTSCCAPKTVTVNAPVLKSLNATLVTAKCRTPPAIMPVLTDFVEVAIKIMALPPLPDMSAFFMTNQQFLQDCQSAVYNTQCTVDTDCYSGSCDRRSGRCTVFYGQEGPALAKCFLVKAPNNILLELKAQLGMQAKYETPAAEAAAFTAQFVSRFSAPDCMGDWSSAEPYKRQMQHVKDPNSGSYSMVAVPGNQTGCLSVMGCNADRWNYQTQASCMSSSLSSSFCGNCQAGQCQDLTIMPSCIINAWTQSDCTSFGGMWKADKYGQQMCFTQNTTVATCFSDPLCNSTVAKWNAAIAAGLHSPSGGVWNQCEGYGVTCYSNATNRDQCTSQSQALNQNAYWDDNLHACKLYTANTLAACTAQGGKALIGKRFQSGQFYDQATCSVGMCNIWRLGPNAPASTCTSNFDCSVPCRKCLANNDPAVSTNAQTNPTPISYCIATAANSTNCASAPYNGAWKSVQNAPSQGQTTSYCVKSLNTQSDCTAAGYSWFDCRSRSSDTCAATNTFSAALQCRWMDHAPCDSQAECNAQGQCDDWEFQTWGSDAPVGKCMVPKSADTHGQLQCKDHGWYAQLKSSLPAGLQYEQWTRIGCIRPDLTTSATCTAAGGVWKTKAKTAAECAAHGQGCSEQNNPWGLSGKQGTVCTSCGGVLKDYYTWTAGVGFAGQMMPLTWKTRAWTAVNSWGSALDYNAMSSAVGNAIASLYARIQINNAQVKYMPLFKILELVGCDCAGGVNCFSTPSPVVLNKCRADPGVPNTCSGVSYNSSAFGGTASATVSISQVNAGAFSAAYTQVNGMVTQATDGKFKLFQTSGTGSSTLSAANYAVVVNSQGAIVGQLLGNAQVVSFSSAPSAPVTLCLTKNPSIPTSSAYTVNDFGLTNSNNQIIPQAMTVTVNGDKFCAPIRASGSYWPVLRSSTWTTITPAKVTLQLAVTVKLAVSLATAQSASWQTSFIAASASVMGLPTSRITIGTITYSTSSVISIQAAGSVVQLLISADSSGSIASAQAAAATFAATAATSSALSTFGVDPTYVITTGTQTISGNSPTPSPSPSPSPAPRAGSANSVFISWSVFSIVIMMAIFVSM